MGAVVTTRPNLKLAMAFGAEMAGWPGATAPLLSRLGGDDAAPDTDRAFLPIAAAHGWAGRIRAGREVDEAWAALGELAADERAPVRAGTLEALVGLGARPGGADALLRRALPWLDAENHEWRWGAAALAIEALGTPRVLATAADQEALLHYLGRAIAEVGEAPRSASRSAARRRLLTALPHTLATVVADGNTGARAAPWLQEICEHARHPDVRHLLSDTINAFRAAGVASGSPVVETLRKTLQASAKPLRDPSRLRPGTGRGKASRRTR
jgi:hypothetical protein